MEVGLVMVLQNFGLYGDDEVLDAIMVKNPVAMVATAEIDPTFRRSHLKSTTKMLEIEALPSRW